MLHAIPKLLEPLQSLLRCVARNQAGVDGPDRGSDQPVGLDAGLVQGLVRADLVGSEGTAALQDQNDLTKLLRSPAPAGRGRRRDRTLRDGGGLGAGPLQLSDQSVVGARIPLFQGIGIHVLHHDVLLRRVPRSALTQCAVQPPSTGSAVPVIEAAASLARNVASAPISSTVAKRLLGCWARRTSRITCSRGIPWDFAWLSICASTRGVQT